jgi:hypothetical protein
MRTRRIFWRTFPLIFLGTALWLARAVVPDPGDPPAYAWLDWWSFSNTNTFATERGRTPVSFHNVAVSPLGYGNAVVLDNTNGAWLQYNVWELDGSTNLTVNAGTVMFWFAPAWSSVSEGGAGPQEFGRLIEAGQYTTNASYGWWSVYFDPSGETITFAAQTNGATEVYLSAPVAWTTNRWHLIALTYSATNTALYIDGVLATNGPGMTVWPGDDVLADGFFIGSDSEGGAQARGIFDDFSTYSFPLAGQEIADHFSTYSFYYHMNPANFANLASAPSEPQYAPYFNAISGVGHLHWQSSNSVGCASSTNVWLTNIVASLATNGAVDVAFAIAGGEAGARYDVFANSILSPASSTNAWAWMGQGYRCNTYSLTNLPAHSVFLILGKPLDSDGDGLTDAYEMLVSKTDPEEPDTDGDGVPDGWELLLGSNPLVGGFTADTSGELRLRVHTPLK